MQILFITIGEQVMQLKRNRCYSHFTEIFNACLTEKTGKCMLHLLEAAEAMIAVGNTQQALQYVDEAESMMEVRPIITITRRDML